MNHLYQVYILHTIFTVIALGVPNDEFSPKLQQLVDDILGTAEFQVRQHIRAIASEATATWRFTNFVFFYCTHYYAATGSGVAFVYRRETFLGRSVLSRFIVVAKS